METLYTFRSRQDARDYRHANGTGGWIFSADDGSMNVLFPPHYCPSDIFRHPLTRGLSGALIGHQ